MHASRKVQAVRKYLVMLIATGWQLVMHQGIPVGMSQEIAVGMSQGMSQGMEMRIP